MSRQGFAQIPNWFCRDASIPASVKATYLALASHADPKGRCWPKQETLAAETGYSADTVQRALTALHDLGLVSWERSQRGNTYTVAVNPPAPSDAAPMRHQERRPSRTHAVSDAAPMRSPKKKKTHREEDPNTPVAPAPAVAEEQLPLDDMPNVVAIAPTRNAGHIVAAWCEGWSSQHPDPADPSLLKRVRGQAAAMAKDRTDERSWRVALDAARCAGSTGRFDIVAALAGPRVAGVATVDALPASQRW